jgi:ankyrin repeat protein
LIDDLIQMGYSVNCRSDNSSRFTAIEKAVNAEQLHALRYLLERGADPNLGKPLLFAVLESNQKSLEIVKILESFGVD